MANTKISELTALGATPADDDVLAIVDTSASATKKVTVANLVAAASGSGQIEKQYRYDGALAVNTGDARLYIPVACSASDINLYLKTASSSGSVGVDFVIDGTVDTSMTIAQGSTSGSGSSSTAISAGSYITFDITSAGTGAEDLYAAISLTRS